ncbi:unnamed protein product [Tuber aestivum]|uniref:Uncharacterized protein n=1 Tax=Tuber aestivum TaxID=59557 RepID=A0A292Q837_9PEZI|nr:unnamed protein product [Tuber aestivum]
MREQLGQADEKVFPDGLFFSDFLSGYGGWMGRFPFVCLQICRSFSAFRFSFRWWYRDLGCFSFGLHHLRLPFDT